MQPTTSPIRSLPTDLQTLLDGFKGRDTTRAGVRDIERQLRQITTSRAPKAVKQDLLAFTQDRLAQLSALNLHATHFAYLERDCLDSIHYQLDMRIRCDYLNHATTLLGHPPGEVMI